ncbi:DeoR/GlpR family DNA-binding transcription regulator [Acinetobacter larvae]|uniref:Alkaline phosphatase n=1 Tax=Acinetobacter larvae TaxID=1789224 RepID=A0A1B2M202_9GAMM|nr:DeoR/GlpR family DNA-binding transcription regulator [Acinetobacter larvae]AOA59199.1 alkaline phosphatase [Acinetobacter larvae]
MLQQERLHRIQALLQQRHNITTERVMAELNISRETARRDFIELEAQGIAKRVHGGLVSTTQIATEAPLQIRHGQYAKEKRAIARCAVQQLSAGQTVFIDAGSTTAILAEELRTLSGLTIISNSLQVILNLSMGNEQDYLNHELILLGGRVQQRMQSQGEQVIREIERYQADLCMLSPVGLDLEQGASSYYLEEANIAAAMRQHSRDCMLLMDHSKLNVHSRVNYARLDQISALITDVGSQKLANFADYQTQLKQVILA